MKRNTKLMLIAAIAILAILLYEGDYSCVGVDGHISLLSGGASGKCCQGLVEKAPAGFVGGTWCLRPECELIWREDGYYDTCTDKLIYAYR